MVSQDSSGIWIGETALPATERSGGRGGGIFFVAAGVKTQHKCAHKRHESTHPLVWVSMESTVVQHAQFQLDGETFARSHQQPFRSGLGRFSLCMSSATGRSPCIYRLNAFQSQPWHRRTAAEAGRPTRSDAPLARLRGGDEKNRVLRISPRRSLKLTLGSATSN